MAKTRVAGESNVEEAFAFELVDEDSSLEMTAWCGPCNPVDLPPIIGEGRKAKQETKGETKPTKGKNNKK